MLLLQNILCCFRNIYTTLKKIERQGNYHYPEENPYLSPGKQFIGGWTRGLGDPGLCVDSIIFFLV